MPKPDIQESANVNRLTPISSEAAYLDSATQPEEALMTISCLKTLAACGLIIAASQGLFVRAQAEDAKADYVAPLDMTSTYAGAIEYPEFLPDDVYRRAMAAPAPETTGANSAPVASKQKNLVAENNNEINAIPEPFSKFEP